MTTPRSCGTCTLCCKLLGISALEKPPGQWCSHCTPGKGCGIYAERPAECASFACLWLSDSQFPDALKPDRTKVVFALDADGQRVSAWVDPSARDAWKQPSVYGLLKRLAILGMKARKQVLVRLGEEMVAILPEQDVPLGVVKPGQVVVYEVVNGHVRVRVTGAAA
jgi:hypothetical protein